MEPHVILCGSSFGLKVRRHRWFEFSNAFYPFAPPCNHKEQGRPIGVYHTMNDEIPCGGHTAKNLKEGQDAMGIGWMQWNELKEAVPPAFSEYLGRHLMTYLTYHNSVV